MGYGIFGGKMHSFFIFFCLACSLPIFAEDMGVAPEAPAVAIAPHAPVEKKSDFEVQVKNCEKVACKNIETSASGKYMIKDVGGVLVGVPLKPGKDDMLSVIYNGVLPSGNAAGLTAPCDLSKPFASIGRQDGFDCRWIDGPDQPCSPKSMIKEFQKKGLKQAIKVEIPPIITSYKQTGKFGKLISGEKERSSMISYPEDPRFGKMCYYQYKK
jgi:hypothetical protein